MINILNKLKKAVNNPILLVRYFNSRINDLPYYIGDGSKAFFPKTVFISVNNICNAHCVMCDVGLKNKDSSFYRNLIQDGKHSLPIKLLCKFLDEIKKNKPLISINATEPLLYKEILNAIELVKCAGLELQLTTNGILLEKYAEDLVKLKLDSLYISLDGLAEVHDKIRGKEVFSKAISGIHLLKQYQKKYSSYKPYIRINCTISTYNFIDLFEFADFMINKLKVDSICFSHLNYVTEDMADRHNRKFAYLGEVTPTSVKIVDPSKIDTEILWNQIMKIKNKLDCFNIRFVPEIHNKEILYKFYNQPNFIVSRKKCTVPWYSATLQPNGDMVILHRCFSFKTGNVYESSFHQIWNGAKYRTFRKELKKNKIFPVCTRCCGIL